MTRFQKIVIALLAALVVIVGVVGFVVVQTVNQQAEQARYEDCLASYGFTRDNVDTDAELDGLFVASEKCSE